MISEATFWILLLLAYLLGSIPFGFLIARWWHGVDLRTRGSRNIGATNTGRVLGKKWGILCLLLDFLKGLIPPLVLPSLLSLPSDTGALPAVAAGTAAILGHIFPIWLGFRGGKGVATGGAVALVLCWPAGLAAVIAFLIVFTVRRTVSLASISAATVYLIATLIVVGNLMDRDQWPRLAFGIAVPLLIIVRHRDNIVRLIRGEEKSFSAKPADSSSSESSTSEQRKRKDSSSAIENQTKQ